MFKDSTIKRPMNIPSQEWDAMAERGRRRAELVLAANPEQRILMEQTFGVEYCKARYPEAYREGVLRQ